MGIALPPFTEPAHAVRRPPGGRLFKAVLVLVLVLEGPNRARARARSEAHPGQERRASFATRRSSSRPVPLRACTAIPQVTVVTNRARSAGSASGRRTPP